MRAHHGSGHGAGGPTPAPVRLVARVVPDDVADGPVGDAPARSSGLPAPGGPGGKPGPVRGVARAGRILSTSLMAGLILIMGVFIGSPSERPAHAGLMDDLCWAITPVFTGAGPQMYGAGGDSLMPGWTPNAVGWEAFVNYHAGTLESYEGLGNFYEQFGMAGTTWSVYTGGDPSELSYEHGDSDGGWSDDEIEDNRCFPVMDFATNMAAQSVFDFSKAMTRLVISTLQLAISEDVFDSFWPAIDQVVDSLRTNLYLDFMQPMIILGAVWMAWNGLVKRRATQTMQGMVWMLVAAVSSLAFMANPSAVAGTANNILGGITSAAVGSTTTLTWETPGEEGDGLDDEYVCSNGMPKQQERRIACGMWKSMVFTPWSVGQFGTANPSLTPVPDGMDNDSMQAYRPSGHRLDYEGDARLAQMDAQAFSHDDVANGVTPEMMNGKINTMIGIAEGYWTSPQWSGENPGSRFTIAVSAFVAAIIGGVLIWLMSVTLITIHLFMLLLTLSAPLFMLFGIHPGFGRRLALRWLELWLGTFMKRLIITFLIALLLGFYQMLFSMGLAWGTELIMILAVSVATLLFRKPIVEMFSQVNLGGVRLEGIEDRQVSKRSVAMATGATVAAVGASRALRGTGASKRAVAKSAAKAAGKGAMRTAHTTSKSRAASAGYRTGERQGRQDGKDWKKNHPTSGPNSSGGSGGGGGGNRGGGGGGGRGGGNQNQNTGGGNQNSNQNPGGGGGGGGNPGGGGPGNGGGPDLGVYQVVGPGGQGSNQHTYKGRSYDSRDAAVAAKRADLERANREAGEVRQVRAQNGRESYEYNGRRYDTHDEARQARRARVREIAAEDPRTESRPGPDLSVYRIKPKQADGAEQFRYKGTIYRSKDDAVAAKRADRDKAELAVPKIMRVQENGRETYRFDGARFTSIDEARAARNARVGTILASSKEPPPPADDQREAQRQRDMEEATKGGN